jgi:ABC-type phosphate transport system substrate-binding protein
VSLRTLAVGCVASTAVLCTPVQPAVAQGADGDDGVAYIVVVNAANPLDAIDRNALHRIFLGQSRNWPGGGAAHPVDQSAASDVRESFSRGVLRQSLAAVNAYWQRQILAGRATPPQVKPSDAEVLDFVASDAQAVGYVASATALPPAVKELRLTDTEGGDSAADPGGDGAGLR